MLLVYVCIGFAVPQLVSYIQQRLYLASKCRDVFKSQQIQTTGPSYPHVPFLLGLDFLYENAMNIFHYRFAEGVRQRFQRYGTTHTARLLHRKMVNTIDPENLKAMMKTNFDDYTIIPGREKLMRVLFGVGVFGTDGHEWKHSRRLVRSAMSSLQLGQDAFEKHFEAMINKIRMSNNGEEEVDFGKVAFDYTLATATDAIIGGGTDKQTEAVDESTSSLTNDTNQFGKDFTILGKMARVLTIMISQIPYLTNIVYWRTYKPTQRRVFGHVEARIQQARIQQARIQQARIQQARIQQARIQQARIQQARTELTTAQQESVKNTHNTTSDIPPSPSKPKTILEGLTAQTDDTTRIRSEALHLLLAGHDTVGIALSELFWCLSRTPHAWARLRSEVSTVLNNELPTPQTLKQLPYLNHIINEAIRIRPTLSVHGRRATHDTVLPRGGGPDGSFPLHVSKGTYIVYSNYALYRNPAVFGDDVDTFRPERWEGPDGAKPARYEFLNFGAGPRYCPGRELGWNMLAYVTVRLAQTVVEIENVDSNEWQEARAFSFHNKNGVKLRMVTTESQ